MKFSGQNDLLAATINQNDDNTFTLLIDHEKLSIEDNNDYVLKIEFKDEMS